MMASTHVGNSAGRHTSAPLPALLAGVREIALNQLHARLAAEGFPGLRFKHDCVFRHIDDEGSRLTDLSERSGLTKQGVAEAVEELAELGYVVRSASVEDRRTKLITLTRDGRAGQRAAERALLEVEQEWADMFGAEQIAVFRSVLEHILHGAEPGRRA